MISLLCYPFFPKFHVLMINLGKINRLHVVAEFPFGFQLAASPDPQDDDELVTLARELAPADTNTGSQLDVFVLTDNSGQLIATPQTPKIQRGEVKVLRAVGATHFGAFFDWGLENDLLVPANYQESPVSEGMNYVVYAFAEEATGRLLGATRLHRFFKETAPYLKVGDNVEALVFAKTNLGYKVLLNEKYLGLIFHSDALVPLKVGDALPAVVKQIREDGKIDVGMQRQDQAGRDALQQAILDDLRAHGGLSTLTDKSPPDAIYKHFNVSKAAYKKALGALFKQRLIHIDKETIRLIAK